MKTTKLIEIDGRTYKIIIEQITKDKCKCGCGKDADGRKLYFNDACRQRACRARKRKINNKIMERI